MLPANLVGHSVVVVEARRQPYLLNNHESLVTQAKLDKLRNRFHIPHVISMRAPKMGEVPQQARRELGEIAFPTIVLECGVRLPLASFVRKLLNEFLLHPLQDSPAL